IHSISIDYQNTTASQPLGYGQFFLDYRFQVSQPGQVGWTDIGDNSDVGLSDSGQIGNLARVIAAELGDNDFILGVGTEQRQRQADIIIEILRGLNDAEMLTQDVVSNLPCCRFAYRAGYCDNLKVHLPTVFASEIAESFYCIADLEDVVSVLRTGYSVQFLADDGAGSAFGKGINNIIVSIEILTTDSKKTIARLSGSRIYTYTGEIRSVTRGSWLVTLGPRTRFLFEMCTYYFSQFCNRKFFHPIFLR
ncbi:unnamed protein product, partial [marine sediment metagenome]